VLTQQNKTDDAIKVFTALTNDYPELPEPYNNLAVLYANQGQYDKARQALELAIRTHPSYATAHENLGDIYAKMASQAYDRALKLDHGNSATQTKLAMIQDLFGANPNKPSHREVTSPSASAIPATPKPSVASAPAEIPPTAAVATPPAADASQDVLKTLHDWAAAWSAKNANKYLAHYADNFKTPNGTSRADWAAERKERIAKPKTIYVAISNPSVKFSDANHAVAEFHQTYHASHLKTTSTKIMFMEKSGGKWLILEERVK
jgi:tetratricopeptide (TPR) repeat protein